MLIVALHFRDEFTIPSVRSENVVSHGVLRPTVSRLAKHLVIEHVNEPRHLFTARTGSNRSTETSTDSGVGRGKTEVRLRLQGLVGGGQTPPRTSASAVSFESRICAGKMTQSSSFRPFQLLLE